MDSDRIEGGAKNLAGRAEEAVGSITGDHDTQMSGTARRVAGKAQESMGQAADEVREYVQDQPLAALLIAGGVGFLLGALIIRR